MKILNITSRSVTIELDSDKPYFHEREYTVYLNGAEILKDNRNVFTLFDLIPDTDYCVKVLNEEIKFITSPESTFFNVLDFNAKGDGISDDTIFIQAAIMASKDNGCVYLPKGTYLVSSLFLKSNLTLYLDKNAKIIAKTDRNEFPTYPSESNIATWEGSIRKCFTSIINCVNVENVNIIGGGTIDCQARNSDWYIDHRNIRIACRGNAVFYSRSKNINLIGLSIKDTQSYAVHPLFSENLKFYNLKIENNPNMPTTDGIDPDFSSNIEIKGNYISVGDDCIAIKSGTYELAKECLSSSKNIVISNNYMEKGHGGVVFGSESSGGITNVLIEKCIFKNTDRGFRLKTRRGRGRIGSIDNVIFRNVYMDNVKTPFVVNMYYNMGPKGGHEEYVWTYEKQPFTDLTPVVGKFKFENIVCENVEYAAGCFLGLPESKIQSLEFHNVTFNYKDEAEEGIPAMIEHPFKLCKAGLFALNVDDIKLESTVFNGLATEEIISKDSI